MVDDEGPDEAGGEGSGGRSGTGPAKVAACVTCRWKHTPPMDPRVPTCDAFPGGIPMEIQLGLNSHREPYRNDRGIRWAPVMD